MLHTKNLDTNAKAEVYLMFNFPDIIKAQSFVDEVKKATPSPYSGVSPYHPSRMWSSLARPALALGGPSSSIKVHFRPWDHHHVDNEVIAHYAAIAEECGGKSA